MTTRTLELHCSGFQFGLQLQLSVIQLENKLQRINFLNMNSTKFKVHLFSMLSKSDGMQYQLTFIYTTAWWRTMLQKCCIRKIICITIWSNRKIPDQMKQVSDLTYANHLLIDLTEAAMQLHITVTNNATNIMPIMYIL